MNPLERDLQHIERLSMNRQDFHDLKAYLASHELAGRLLGLALSEPTDGSLLANSYRHDNGFYKVVLWSSVNSQFKIVLHVWPGEEGQDRWDNIHNHRWDFVSSVLLGAIDFEQYEQHPSGQQLTGFSYGSPDGGTAYSLTEAGQFRIVPTVAGRMATGSCYSLPHQMLHRAWGEPATLTATLVLQRPPAVATTLVLPRGEQATGEAVRLPQFDHHELMSALRMVSDALGV